MRQPGLKKFAVICAACAAFGGGRAAAQGQQNLIKPAMSDVIKGNVYADNWFMLYINGKLIAVDSIDFLPHNQVSVDVLPEYPMTIAVMAKDNADPKTGLEYGTQIGDAGFILRFADGTVTSRQWKAKAFSRGPVNRDVANPRVQEEPIPANWQAADFDDSAWEYATEYSEDRVKPDGNYAALDFAGARFIWTDDLDLDNTVIFRYRVEKPGWTARWNTKPELDNSCVFSPLPANCPCGPPPGAPGAGGEKGLPGPPLNVSATAGNGSVSVAFSPPASNGGFEISSYTATCTASGAAIKGTAAGSPIEVKGLSNGTTYSCTVSATNSAGTGGPSEAVTVTPAAGSQPAGEFSLTSAAAPDGGQMPAEYTCDGAGSTIPLAWSNAPAGTKEFAMMMTTQPGDGTTKWNWVLYQIPATTTSLLKDSFLAGTAGVGSDGPGAEYNPPCSQGPGAKLYKYTLYALSGSPAISVPPGQATGQILTEAIAPITLGSVSLTLSHTRTSQTGTSAACAAIRSSTRASKSGVASVSCDDTYAYGPAQQ